MTFQCFLFLHLLLLVIYVSSTMPFAFSFDPMLCILQVADSLCSGSKPTTNHACNGGTHCTFCSGNRAKCSGHGICSNVKGACVCDTGYSVSMPTLHSKIWSFGCIYYFVVLSVLIESFAAWCKLHCMSICSWCTFCWGHVIYGRHS